MQKFLVRQPIFDPRRIVFGYELLFRSGPENYFQPSQPDVSCAGAAVPGMFVESVDWARRAFSGQQAEEVEAT